MVLYLTERFYGRLAFYLAETENWLSGQESGEERKFRYSLWHLRALYGRNSRLEEILAMVDVMLASPYANRERCDGWRRLKKEFPGMEETDLLNLYAVLFAMADDFEFSFPVRRVLLDRYAQIVTEIARDGQTPVVFENEKDMRRFEDRVCEVLCRYAVAYCPPDDVLIWSEEYNGSGIPAQTEPEEEPDYGSPQEEYRYLTCYVHITDPATVERMKKASFAAGYQTADVDAGGMLMGNMLTFATEDLSDAVTLQITHHRLFDAYEQMFRTLGPEAFGCEGRTPEECAAETEQILSRFRPEGPLALAVRKLSRPVLKKKDFVTLQMEGVRS